MKTDKNKAEVQDASTMHKEKEHLKELMTDEEVARKEDKEEREEMFSPLPDVAYRC